VPPHRKLSKATVIAAVWGVLLIPLAVFALDMPAILSDAVSFAEQITITVLRTVGVSPSELAQLQEQVDINVLHTYQVPQGDGAAVGDQVAINVFRTYQAPEADVASVSDQVVVSLILSATSTTLSSNTNPSSYGALVTLTASVTASGGNPGTGAGTVDFKEGSSIICAAVPLSGNQATCSTGLPAGNHAFTAAYSGTARYAASSGGLLQQVSPASLTITASDATKVYGDPNPPFAVQYDGFVNGEMASVLSGSLSIAAPAATSRVGTYTGQLVPSGLTSANYAITYVNGTLTITPAPITVTVNDATRYYGQSNPSFSVTVGALVNGDSATSLGTPAFSTLATRTSPVGDYSVSASGLGNPNYTIRYVSGTLHIAPAPTATTLASAPNPVFIGTPVTLTATVTSTVPAGVNPGGSGTVSFKRGAITLATVALNSSGHASASITTLPVGHDTLSAVYSGDTNYLSSASPVLIQVVKGNTIVFSSNRDGNIEIYAIAMSSGSQTRLTNNAAIDTMPAYAPDGTRIAFTSTRSGTPQIWLMNADGSNLRQLTTDPGVTGTPAWSPDGTRLVYTSTRSGSLQLWIVGTTGPYPATNQQQLTPNALALANTTPSWSSNGLIAFTSIHGGLPQIWVINANGASPATRLSTDSAIDTTPAWSPDSSRIAFSSTMQGAPAIYVMDANGGNVSRITANGLAIDSTPSWSPDGTMITFTSTLGGVLEIYQVRADGTGQTQITSGPAFNAGPAWCCTQAP
jgi:Tol biopolymer transport system component